MLYVQYIPLYMKTILSVGNDFYCVAIWLTLIAFPRHASKPQVMGPWWQTVPFVLWCHIHLDAAVLFPPAGLICRGAGLFSGCVRRGLLSQKRKLHSSPERPVTQTPHGPQSVPELPPGILCSSSDGSNHGTRIAVWSPDNQSYFINPGF